MSSADAERVFLPPPVPDQAYMIVSALEAGLIDLPAHRFAKDVPMDEIHKCPSLAFYLKHSKTSEHLVFDLGIRKKIETVNPSLLEALERLPCRTPQDVSESLLLGGIKPEDIQTIVLSHVHWDHVGDHSLFPNATFILGEEAEVVLADAKKPQFEGYVLSDSVPSDRVKYLPSSLFSDTIAGFPAVYDYFGDGSLYIVDSAGHLGGHINILARTSADGSWIYLGGDTCHDLRILRGEKEVFFETDAEGRVFNCIHQNKDAAVEHIRRVGRLRKAKGVHVLIAHDYEWYEENKGGPAFFPGKIRPAIIE